MNFRKGDVLVLKENAFNPDTKEILFNKGIEVTIEKIKSDVVEIKFPNNVIYQHNKQEIPYLFANKSSGKILSNSLIGTGTPPKDLFNYLPKEANWKKNYIWKVHIELEEREDKEIICPDCTFELKDNLVKDELNRVTCTNCNKTVLPFNIKENF